MICALAAALILCPALALASPTVVMRVIDGDTIVIVHERGTVERVRVASARRGGGVVRIPPSC